MEAMISYHVDSSKDGAYILKLLLESELGVKCWICHEDLRPGDHFRDIILERAVSCKYFIILVNERWAASRECQYEYNTVEYEHRKHNSPTIIPIFLDDMKWNNDGQYRHVKGIMANYQGIFLKKDNWDDVLQTISVVFKDSENHPNVSAQPAPLPTSRPIPRLPVGLDTARRPSQQPPSDSWRTSVVSTLSSRNYCIAEHKTPPPHNNDVHYPPRDITSPSISIENGGQFWLSDEVDQQIIQQFAHLALSPPNNDIHYQISDTNEEVVLVICPQYSPPNIICITKSM